jgi:hypothetical protein
MRAGQFGGNAMCKGGEGSKVIIAHFYHIDPIYSSPPPPGVQGYRI